MKSVYVPFRIMSFTALAFLTFSSCQKTDKAPSPPKSQDVLVSATNGALGVGVATDVSNDETSCAVVTYIPSRDVYPHQKIADFGAGCTGDDGITRSGKIMTTFYADPETAPVGTFLSETRYEDYFVDNVKVEGFARSYVEETGDYGLKTEKAHVYRRYTATDGSVQTNNETRFTKQVNGYNTKERTDDIYEITGSADGTETLADGTAVKWVSKNSEIRPLIKQSSCQYSVVAGIKNVVLEYTAGGEGSFLEKINYGNGSCDNTATISVNHGEPVEVTLPLYFWPLGN